MAALEGSLKFQLVVAATKKLGIGNAGSLPWKIPGDMAYFKELTSRTVDPAKQNAVIMGRKTWESIPPKFRPLAGRLNIVLSRSEAQDENSAGAANGAKQAWRTAAGQKGVQIFSSLENALSQLGSESGSKRPEMVFVIGGGQVYKEAIQLPQCSAIHLTEIEEDIQCDTFFPALDFSRWRLWSAGPPKKHKDLHYSFLCYTAAREGGAPQLPAAINSRHEEYQNSSIEALEGYLLSDPDIRSFLPIQHCHKERIFPPMGEIIPPNMTNYLEMVEDVVENGAFREDRTGTGTFSKFGTQMRFNLRRTFPLLTTKRVFWRGVAEELFWFLKGSTNARELKDKGIHIWDGNSSREYLDSIGLKDREENDLGPVYGFQWRHFAAQYTDMHADYSGKGVDQLAQVVHKLRTNPTDRRIILSAWNPAALPEMALPPCHMFAQFYVADGELSCQMYQRSADLGLGVPFNIASYALLTCLLAKVVGLRPGDFVHVLGDVHVYANHVEPLKEQLKNPPRPFPTLQIKGGKEEIEDYSIEDLELLEYMPHKKIAMQMAV